jgi:hypothetical protein
MESPLSLPSSKRNPAEFANFIDKHLGTAGFKASTRGKPGFIAQAGRFAGQSKDAAMARLGDEFDAIDAAAPVKLAGGKPPAAQGFQMDSPIKDPGIGRDGSKAPMYGMDGKTATYDNLNWLEANRTTGDALKRQERNVAVTGSRNREPGDELSLKERAISTPAFTPENLAKVRSGQASLAADKASYAADPTKTMPSRVTPVALPPRLSGKPTLSEPDYPKPIGVQGAQGGLTTGGLQGAVGGLDAPGKAVAGKAGGKAPPGFGTPIDPNSLVKTGFEDDEEE